MSARAIGEGAVLLLLAAFAVVGARFEMLPHDVAYYLYVSRELLDGAVPYRDYIDPNLPTIIYLGVPVALVSEWTGVPIWTVYRGFVLAIEAGALGAIAWLLRRPGGVADPEQRAVVTAIWLVAIALVPMGLIAIDSSHFGQREHLALVFVAPYVVWHALRAGGGGVGRGAAVAIALYASIGIAIKPHFLVFWAALEAWALRREGAGGARIGWLPGIAFAVYFALLLVVLPDLARWIGLTWELYGAYRDRTPLEILGIAPVALSLAVLLMHRAIAVEAPLRPQRAALALAAAVWWCIGFGQLRGFTYHFAPAVSLAFALLLVCIVGNRLGRKAIPVVYALLVFVGFASVEAAWRDRFGQDVSLTALLEEKAPDGSFLLLSTNVWPSFPAALYANTRWASRFPALWLLPGLYEDEPVTGGLPFRDPSAMGETERWHLDAVIEDFARQPPDVVLVDRSRFQPGFGRRRFDYLAYFLRDARFRKLWCPFRPAGRWEETFFVFVRDADEAARCAARAQSSAGSAKAWMNAGPGEKPSKRPPVATTTTNWRPSIS